MALEFVDTFSGHPYAFVPSIDVPSKAVWGWIDLHHKAHPGSAEELQGRRGEAIRNVMGQLVNWRDHHKGWHERGHKPDTLPSDDVEGLRYVTFALGGYLHMGCRFNRGDIQIVELNDRQKQRLWYSGERGVINMAPVKDYLVSQMMDEPVEDDIEQRFFRARSPRDIRLLGHQVLDLKVRSLVAEVEEDYLAAYQEGMLHPEAPERPAKLVHDTIGEFYQRDRIVLLMHSNGQTVD